MKAIRFISISFIFIIVFISCKQSTTKHMSLYNGISPKILNIVDSMQVCKEEDNPFITIWFSALNDSDFIVRFKNTIIIPALPEPPAPMGETLISKHDGFIGYKKYGDKYLVFLDYYPNRNFERFVKRDSLCKDEKPFKEYNIYEWKREIANCHYSERIYSINKEDSLIFMEEKEL